MPRLLEGSGEFGDSEIALEKSSIAFILLIALR